MCTKRQLLSLIGKLIFASRVIKQGRTFVGRLIDLSKKLKHLHYRTKLSYEAKADIGWWIQCLHKHNGIHAFPSEWITTHTLNLYSDSSDLGIGAVFGSEWFCLAFQGSLSWIKTLPINWRELYALVKAIATWGKAIQGKRVTLYIDNQTVVYCINKGASRSPDMMSLIRSLYMLLALYDIECRAIYLSTYENSSADALSRMDICRFRRETPHACKYMTWPNSIAYNGKDI